MIEVRIKDVDGSLKPYYIDENSTIRILKEQIQRDEGHDAAKQVLLSCGQRLEDSRTLSSYNVGNGFVIHCRVPVPSPNDEETEAGSSPLATIFVSPPIVGPDVLIFNNIPRTTTVDDFKDLVQQRTGDDLKMIRICFGGREFQSVSRHGRCLAHPDMYLMQMMLSRLVMTLKDYGVGNNSTLHYLYRIFGD